MATKMTNKEMFTVIASIVSTVGIPDGIETSATPEEILNWIEVKLDQLNKKATTLSKKQKEKIEADNGIIDTVMAILQDAEEPMTVSDIIKSSDVLSDLSSQKVTALLKRAVDAGTVKKEKVKNKSMYSIATEKEDN